MASWGAQRQTLILLVFFALVVGAFSGIYLVYFKPEPSCFDGIQNQGELGIDCGGGCAAVCESEVTPLVTFWTRVFQVNDGVYDVAAMLENPNGGYAIGQLGYLFKAYDANNILVLERAGSTYVNPKERFVIVEPRLNAGNRVPVRAVIEFSPITWKRLSGEIAPSQRPAFTVEDKSFTPDPRPRLAASVVNNSAVEYKNIAVSAVVLDVEGNALGVSSTLIDALPRDGREQVVFTWPRQFEGIPVTTEIFPRVDVVAP